MTVLVCLDHVGDMDAKELEALHLLHYSPVDENGGMLSSFVSITLRERLLSLHHTVRSLISSIQAVSALSVIRHCCVINKLNDGVGRAWPCSHV